MHVLVPEGLEDPRRPSGGNHYDRRLVEELRAVGWQVHLHHDAADVPSGAVLLVDGLVADRAVAHTGRLRVVLLLHMPYDGPLLAGARAVLATSAWTARQQAGPVHVARPGVDPAAVAIGSSTGGALLCVGAVVPGKGHDVLLDAVAKLDDLDWRVTCVGSTDRDAAWAESLRSLARVSFTGPLVGADLDSAYASADLLVLPTRQEAYGMVVTESLARGIPVVASDVGGVPEALGTGGGLLVPPDDPGALADALRRWLEDPALRTSLRAAARQRRTTLAGWDHTAAIVSAVLDGVAW